MKPAPPVTSTRTAGKVVLPSVRRWLLLILVASLVVVAVAAVQVVRRGGHSVDDALRELRPSHPYYLGRTFESLPLSRIARRGDALALTYGDCERRCVTLQQLPLAGHNPVAYLRKVKRLPCTRTTVRGAPAAFFDGLEVYTGARTVSLFARTRGEELRMAAALRRLGATTPRRLAPPALDLSRALAACPQRS